jgi:glycosyltransferase involved in cell wall biosynthesis
LPASKWTLAAYLAWHRIDLVQVANLRFYTEAARLARVPVVVERTDGIRGGAALHSKEGLDAVIASTRGTIPELAKLIDPSRIHLIYNGVEVEHYAQAKSERFGFAPEDIIIGRVSRLGRGKNISLLIQAVKQLREHDGYQHVRLVICGGDTTQVGAEPMMAELKNEASALGSSVVFTGEVFDPAEVVAGFDIATCTSRPNNEGIPNSLIEAMAAAKPIVATTVDDIPELVEHEKHGLLVPSDDATALTKALRRLVDAPYLRQRYGQAGQEKARREFSLEPQSRCYATLYRELLKQKGRG